MGSAADQGTAHRRLCAGRRVAHRRDDFDHLVRTRAFHPRRPPGRATTTETLKPMLSHLVSAALAMVCAIASGIFFWVTSPCAAAEQRETSDFLRLQKTDATHAWS